MSEWSPDSDDSPESPDASDSAPSGVRVVTAYPVRLRVVRTAHDRAPEGAVVFRTLGVLDPQVPNVPDDAPVLAQGALPEATFAALERSSVFTHPVPLMLDVREDTNGLSGVLYAIVRQDALEEMERALRADDEPWLASLDAPVDFAAPSETGEDDEEDDVPHAPFALGAIVRFAEDRRHPESLPEEAVDLLASLLVGKAMDADRKRVELFLRSL